MLSLIHSFYRAERGATATEYALLIVFVALAIAGGAQVLGTNIGTLFTNIASNLLLATVPTP
jgi:pilus assembly protein Flp/PilA